MFSRDKVSSFGLIFGLFTLSLFLFSDHPEGLSRIGWLTAGVALLMTIWWVTEAIPIYVTGLIPLILFPVFNIFNLKIIASSYSHPLVLLFLGGFIIASAMESSGLHKRIALNLLRLSGTSPSKIIAGFMITTALISMWVSNTASTIMMLPIAASVINIFYDKSKKNNHELAVPLLLAIAYSASIGGAATLIGTPTNIMLASILSENYNYSISFSDWLAIGFPIVLILLPLVWLFLTKISFKVSTEKLDSLDKAIIVMKDKLGVPTLTEKIVGAVFLFTASLWIFRRNLNEFFDLHLNDTSIGLFGAILLFLLPIGEKNKACSWDTANKIPWGVLLLVGGGIALSRAFNDSGLAIWIGSYATFFAGYDVYLLVFLAVVLIIFLTELNSNTATIATFAPILIIFSIELGQNPLFFVIPATIAASCAFMLPIATPPNAVVFGSGKLDIKDMLRAGFFLNIISAFTVTIICIFLVKYVFGLEISELPSWAI